MKTTNNLWLANLSACAILSLTAVPALALADVYVIANSATAVTEADIRDIFLGDKQLAGGTKLVPVDNAPAQDEFLSKALKMESAKYNSTWTKKSFREGLNPPSVRSGDLEVIDFVKKTPGAVGYVKSSPSGVKVLQKF